MTKNKVTFSIEKNGKCDLVCTYYLEQSQIVFTNYVIQHRLHMTCLDSFDGFINYCRKHSQGIVGSKRLGDIIHYEKE